MCVCVCVHVVTAETSLGTWHLNRDLRTSLVVQWLRHYTSTAGAMGSIPSRGTKIPHDRWFGKKKKNQKNK